MSERKRRIPGYRWRTLAWHDDGEKIEQEYDGTEGVCFDELVVDEWFHIEQMDTRDWWMQVGDLHINIHINPDKTTEVTGWSEGEIELAGESFLVHRGRNA